MIHNYLLYLIGALLLTACSGKDPLLTAALEQAGKNRNELEKVLNRYRNEDREKYLAACFLVRNMPFHGSYEGEELNKYLKYYEVYSANIDRDAQEIVDSLEQADGKFHIASLNRQNDINVIDSAFLTRHIDWAFKVWREQPWGKNVTFKNFCEYILPYRIADEPLSLWREELYKKYNPVLDSLRNTPDANNPLQAAQVILAHLGQQQYKSASAFPKGPSVGPKILEWRVGNCEDFTAGLTYVCRALGIPCGSDYVLLWGDYDGGHSWNFTVDKDGKSYACDSPSGSYKSWKECKAFSPKCKGKVYRRTFNLNEDRWQLYSRQPIYPTFRNPLTKDVTENYLSTPKQAIEIPEDFFTRKPQKGEVIYLCLTNKWSWQPIDYTIYKGGAIKFEPIEGNITCTIASWNGQKLTLLCPPFYIEEDVANLKFFLPGTERQTARIFMKYHRILYDSLHIRMKGGVIEGSNQEDFAQADTLYTITRVPYRRFSVAKLKTGKPYRYIRYRGAKGSHCNIAELSFYVRQDDTIPLRGRIIGTPNDNEDGRTHEYTNVFDGNTETSFDYKEADNGWAGMDFGKPVSVGKAIYTPRNRVNFIYKGNEYELFYWNNGAWHSLGRQTATADSLVYQAPANALLYLKCHIGGKEERIFECKDGEVVFR